MKQKMIFPKNPQTCFPFTKPAKTFLIQENEKRNIISSKIIIHIKNSKKSSSTFSFPKNATVVPLRKFFDQTALALIILQ